MKSLIRVCLSLSLILPLLVVIAKTDSWSLPDWAELWLALKNTLLQSLLSASGALLIGFISALGVLKVKSRRNLVEFALLIPTFVPSLFVLLACLQLINPFPFGIVGIVIVHTVIYSGLMAVMISRLLESRVGGFAELALIEGASRSQLLLRGVIPYLSKDLLMLFTYLVAVSLSSFSVPLVVGGSGISTLEILIYEKALVEFNFSQAIFICFLQFSILFILSQLSSAKTVGTTINKNLSLLEIKYAHWPAVLGSIGLVVVNMLGFEKGVQELRKLENLMPLVWQGLLGSGTIALLTGLITVGLLFGIAYATPHARFEKWLQSFVAPSTALMGIGFLLLGGGTQSNQTLEIIILKISAAFSLLVICSLYRLQWSSRLDGISLQIRVAKTLGSSDSLTFYKIIVPQLLPDALLLAGVASFWVCGDFALSQLITGQPLTLALVASGLMGAYRLESATVFIWLSLLVGAAYFFVFWSLSHVAHKKYIS